MVLLAYINSLEHINLLTLKSDQNMFNLMKFRGKVLLTLPNALGELTLVTLGILIALSNDNWNDDRLERKSELEHLTSINEDLELNLDRNYKYRADIKSAEIVSSYLNTDTLDNTKYFNYHNMNGISLARFNDLYLITYIDKAISMSLELSKLIKTEFTIKWLVKMQNFWWENGRV